MIDHVICGYVVDETPSIIIDDSYSHGGEAVGKYTGRYVHLRETMFENLDGFRNTYVALVKSIRKKKFENLSPYTVDENLRALVKPGVAYLLDHFPELKELVRKNRSEKQQVAGDVSEEQIRDFFAQPKEKIIKTLKEVEKNLETPRLKGFLKKTSIAVLLTTYNEENAEKNISAQCRLKQQGLLNEVIVSDGFSEINDPLELKQKGLDFTLLRQGGVGKGEAVETGTKYSLVKKHDFVIVLDSDQLSTVRTVYPDAEHDIDTEFFTKRFITEIWKKAEKEGLQKAKNTFFKASYMRMPQTKRSLEPRFGYATPPIKKFMEKIGLFGQKKNLYPLSGEHAFNPRFLLEKLCISRQVQKIIGVRFGQINGNNVPSGFCLEAYWNARAEMDGLSVNYVNTWMHHHGPVEKTAAESNIEKQRGEVLTGAVFGVLESSYRKKPEEKTRELLAKIPRELVRTNRPHIRMKLDGKKVLRYSAAIQHP